MPKYQITLAKSAHQDIDKLPVQIRKRLKSRLQFFIAQNNPLAFAKPLKEPASAQYRFRIGTYRALFDVEGRNIVILHVKHRREVYRK